jgi:diguanylate cyclase (GGDEF)-like protein
MSLWLVPISVELLITLLFCGVLYYLRRSLTRRALAFWLFLWVARGVASLFALRYLSADTHVIVLLYAPLQIAFAMALVVIAVRVENQKEQLHDLHDELVRLRTLAAGQLDVDPLTGLKNRTALSRWIDEEHEFHGLVVVCDMDDFKSLNDVFGHLVGDEILHGVGHLIRSSIRDDDLAFRWGGDEFVVFFRAEDNKLVEERMRGIEDRLRTFYVRHHGQIAIRFSWGIARTTGRPLRDSLAEADRLMYESKRARRLEPPSGRTSVSV